MSELNIMTQSDLDDLWAKIKSRFVDDIGFSSNKLTWKVGGVAQTPFTIGYATNAGTATKLGSNTVGASDRPIYLNAGTATAVSSVGEAFLSWGGKESIMQYLPPVDCAIYPLLGNNMAAFIPAANVTIEYSTDGGTTWLDYEATDAQKTGLFTDRITGFTIGKTAPKTTDYSNYLLRVTLDTEGEIYTSVNKFILNIGNGYAAMSPYCTVETRTQEDKEDNTNTWTKQINKAELRQYYTTLNVSPFTTYYSGSTKTTIGQIRFTFGVDAYSSTYAGLIVYFIALYGRYSISSSYVHNEMARTGHLYAYDALQNATFPALVTTKGLQRAFTASDEAPALNIRGNYDNWIFRVSRGSSYATSATYGFGLKYLGTATASYRDLVLYADNQTGTQVEAIRVKQNGDITLTNVTAAKFIGPLQGNADTATSATGATNDSDGNPINTTYLKLAGGTMTGIISKSSGGQWIKARDNVIIKTTSTGTSQWHPAVGVKTINGHWSIGYLDRQDSDGLSFSYDTDTDYNNNTNTNIEVKLRAVAGTIALTSELSDTATAADNILHGTNSGTQITYAPYTSKQNGLSFYTGTTNPDDTTRLNLNGYLYATKLYSGGNEVLTSHQTIYGLTIKNSAGTSVLSYNPKTAAGDLTLTAAMVGVSATTTSVTVGSTTFNQYVHPTSAGNIHLPSGGASGQFLGYGGASGTGAWKTGELIHPLTNVSGTAAVTTSGSRNAAIWEGTADGVTSLYTGLMVTIKVPVAGNSDYGTVLDINSLGEHPVCANVSTAVSTRYAVNCIITLIYDNEQTASAYKNNASKSYTGVWKIADYDSTIVYRLNHNYASCITTTNLYRQMLLLQKNETTYVPINAVNGSTATTKTLTTESFNPFGNILYYFNTSNTGVNAGTAPAANYLSEQYLVDLRYSFNTGSSLTANKDVFIVASVQTDGTVKLHSSPITQTLPTTDGDLIYIYLGTAYDTYRVEMFPVHPVYWHKDGKVQLYTPMSANALRLTTTSKTAWGRTFWTANGVPDSISGSMSDVGTISIDNNNSIRFKKNNSSDFIRVMALFTDDTFRLGSYINSEATDTMIYGSKIEFYVHNGANTNLAATIDNAKNFNAEGDIRLNNDQGIFIKNYGTSGTYKEVLKLDYTNDLALGFETGEAGYDTYVCGKNVKLRAYDSTEEEYVNIFTARADSEEGEAKFHCKVVMPNNNGIEAMLAGGSGRAVLAGITTGDIVLLGDSSYQTMLRGSSIAFYSGSSSRVSINSSGYLVCTRYARFGNNYGIQMANTGGSYLDALKIDNNNKLQVGNTSLGSEMYGTDITFYVGSNVAATIDTNKNLTSQGSVVGTQGVAAFGIADLSLITD